MQSFLKVTFALVFSFCILSSSGNALLAFMDKNVYEVGDDITFKVNMTGAVNVSIVIVDSTEDVLGDFSIPNGTSGLVEQVLSSPAFPADDYVATIGEESDSVTLNFRVVTEILKPAVRLMGSPNPIFVETGTVIKNETGGINGNFSELLALNKTDLFYGEIKNITGNERDYSFLLMDRKSASVFDEVYIDDDIVFQLYNDTEDNTTSPFLETSKKPGDMLDVDSTHRYIVSDIERSGKGVYLIQPLTSPAFSSSGTLYMLVMVFDKDGKVQYNKNVNISIHDESKTLIEYSMVNTGPTGYTNLSVSLSGYSAGRYVILANETPADVFKVETFKLHGKSTDLSNNQMSSFAPGSKAKIWAISRDVDGDLMALDSAPSGTMKLPDGSTATLTFTEQPDSTGVYTAETPSLSSSSGVYKVVITGAKGSDMEKFELGFSVRSVEMMVMAMNPKYMDSMMVVNAFPNPSNITVAVFLINKSAGGGSQGGAPCMGESCVAVDCSDYSQFSVMVRDEAGNKFKLSGTPSDPGFQTVPLFSSMPIKVAAQMYGQEPPKEPGLGDQCIIILWTGNYTYTYVEGTYKVEIKFSNKTIGIGDLSGGAAYKIQRLLATGSTVDMKGDSFSFFAPNSTVRMKLEIRDMLTDNLLTADKILNAKFTSMWKEWPERKNAFTEMSGFSKELLNGSMDGDKLVFTSPPEEGFYSAEFRFTADVYGTPTEGTGMIFFELKKYMIWANLETSGDQTWFVKVGENISLTVSIMDIDMGSQYGKEGASASCTGCAGLVATVGALRNEQFFKEMKEGVDYNVETGLVINSTSGATVTINPINLPSGWYGLDMKLYNPLTNESYYGWGGFEIRNFFVDMFQAENITSGPFAGNYTRMDSGKGGGGSFTVPVDGSAILAVAAFEPPTPMSPPSPLLVASLSDASVVNNMMWPPLPVPGSKYQISQLGVKGIVECQGEENCGTYPAYFINFTTKGTIDEGSYMVSMRVSTASSGSDVGSAGFTVSSYVVDKETVPLSKMFEWPPVYANSEKVQLNFTATDFGDNPHNIMNVTIEEMYSQKLGRPIKLKYEENYSNDCTGVTDSCLLSLNLSGLSSGDEYKVRLRIVDDMDSEQYDEFGFQIKNLLFSVPQIYEGWTMDYSTPEKTIDAWYGEDTCNNEMRFNGDQCQNTSGNIVCTYGIGEFTIPYTKNSSTHYHWARMCINTPEGRWNYESAPGDPCPGGKFVFIVSNGTNVWINESANMINASSLTVNDTFTLLNYSGLTWKVESLRQNEPSYVWLKLSGKICARNDQGIGGNNDMMKIVPPADSEDYSSFYHGPSYIIGDMWCNNDNCKDWIAKELDIEDRPVYVYHNTTHLWLYPNIIDANFTDSEAQGPVAPGGVINDGYGGLWKVVSLSKGVVTLRGVNILSRGIMVNTSLSTSGNVWIGQFQENMMGSKNKMTDEQSGLDLDGDGLKNSTLYFLILDDGNGYNKLAFSSYDEKWNFTNSSRVVSVTNANRSLRQVGVSDMLTLLNIDPRARNVKLYDPQVTGDWPELGDSRLGDNVTIPIIVRSPAGNPVAANVSIMTMKVKTDTGMKMVPITSSPVLIDGIGEIRMNVSALGFGSGGYEFEVMANSSTLGVEKLNEWMWPRTTIRNFLIDASAGYGGVISSFATMSVSPYGGWMEGTRIRDLRTRNQTVDVVQDVVPGVMAFVQHGLGGNPGPGDLPDCPQFAYPLNAGNDPTKNNRTYVIDDFDGQYFAYMTMANESRMWIKQGNCNFSVAPVYSTGSPINITLGPEFYMLYVLNATMGNGDFGAIGLANFSPSTIQPLRMNRWDQNPAPAWNIISMNLSGTVYNVVFANDTSLTYPQAATWGMQEISKVVWIDTDGDFADAQRKEIGDVISGNKYLARVGPGPWEGILVGDSTNLTGLIGTAKPGLDIKARDNTPVYFGIIDESEGSLDIDLNVDDDTEDVFYLAAFDDFDDGNMQLTRMYIDDDLNMSEPWWANSSNPQKDYEDGKTISYYDFYGIELGLAEQEGWPPKGMWGGNIRFAPWNQSIPWEESAEWQIRSYNGTHMLLEKNIWGLNKEKTISLTVKAFDFAQSPIVGANISLVKVMRFGGGQPFKELNATDFTLLQTQNITDSKGFGMLKIVPPGGGWVEADYIAVLNVEYNGKSELTDNYFRVGQMNKGGPK